jgi:hypothetical protein
MRIPFTKQRHPSEISKPRSLITDKLDTTKFYAGYDFQVTDQILAHQPTVGEIIDYGETKYYGMVYAMTSIPSDRISELWDMGVDFCKVPEIEFFFSIVKNFEKEDTRILFGDTVDFTKLEIGLIGEGRVLFDESSGVLIDEVAYSRLTSFICKIHSIKKERVSAAGRMALMGLIEVDRQEKAMVEKKEKKPLILLPLLSSMENSPGFKYRLEEAMDLPIFRFMDSVQRISLITNTNQMAIGHYTGNFDQKKFKPETALNWTRDLYE